MNTLRRLLASAVLALALLFGAGFVQPAAAETAPAAAVAVQDQTEVEITVEIIEVFVIDFETGTIEPLLTIIIITVTETAA